MAKRIMSLLVVMTMMLSLLCGTVFATEVTESEGVTITEVATTLPEAVNGVITLTQDVELTGLVNVGETVTINLNGHNIIRSNGDGSSVAIYVNNSDVVLTIEGEGTVTANGPAVWVANGKAVLKGGTYNSIQSSTIYSTTTGYIEVVGGTYKNDAMKTDASCYVLNLKDSDRGTAKIVATGGNFEGWNPADNGAEGNGTNFVKEGYKAVSNGTNYTVVVDEEYNFFNAIAAGGTVTLNADIELSKALAIEKSVTINLNGHNITRSKEGNSAVAIYVNHAEAVVTIEGEGTVSAHGPAVWTRAGKTILNGGTYTSYESDTIYAQGTGRIEITGGTYKSDSGCFVTNLYDSDRATASISVTGGTFINWDPSNNAAEGANTNFVADGYKAYANGSTYVVSCAHKSLAGYPLKEATLVEEGCQAYYECNNCHKLFMDAAATTEVANKADLVIPKLVEIKGTEAIVSDAAVLGAIQDAQDSTVVEVPVLVADTTVKEVTVSVASVEAVANENKGLLIETSDVTVTLDAKTVATVAEQAGEATNITIEVTKEEIKILNTAQKDAVKDKKVEVVISAKILANGKEISDFKGGKVTIEIPFKPAEGLNISDYRFIFIDDDGKVTEIPSKYFDGVMVVELEHFSEYAIVSDVPATNEGGTGSVPEAAPAPAPAAPVKDNTPKTGAISVIGLVSAMAVGGLVLTRKRK